MSSIEKAAARLSAKTGPQSPTEQDISALPAQGESSVTAPIAAPATPIVTRAAAGSIPVPAGDAGVRLEGLLAEQYRLVKRKIRSNLQTSAQGAARNLVMVTSALAGEGKSFTSLNLARSFAMEMDHTVLLVDVDFVKATLSRQFGLIDVPGLTDILTGRATMAEAMRRTEEPKLTILPSGTLEKKSAELLGSERMRHFAIELSERYADRIVLFDAPPLLATTHAAMLSGLVGQVLMVVAQDATPQRAVADAVSLLAPGPVAGFLLNKGKAAADVYYGSY